MKDLIESMTESASSGGDKLQKVAADIKAVAKEMGMELSEAVDKVKELVGVEMDDDEDVMDDGMDEQEQAEEPMDMGKGKKALVIAMLKKKNGK